MAQIFGIKKCENYIMIRSQTKREDVHFDGPVDEGLCPTMQTIEGLEDFVATAPAESLQCFAGVALCSIYITKRWRDARRTRDPEHVFHRCGHVWTIQAQRVWMDRLGRIPHRDYPGAHHQRLQHPLHSVHGAHCLVLGCWESMPFVVGVPRNRHGCK